MRGSQGDYLVVHLAQARQTVLLCAPFVKTRVLARLFDVIPQGVRVRVVTRWHPAEIKSGASDLEVLDVVRSRDEAELALLDELHAKAYVVDDCALVGSANLTARALEWRKPANVEMLVPLSVQSEAFIRLANDLEASRPATDEERVRMREEAAALELPDQADDDDIAPGAAPEPWLPTMSAPKKLFDAYAAGGHALASGVRESAQRDLAAIAIDPDLDQAAFDSAVGEALTRMPGPRLLLERVARDGLLDEEAARLVSTLVTEAAMSHASRWEVMRDWIETFLWDRYEVTPETFVTRRRAS